MHGSFFCLVFLLNYCSSEQLLGGWSVASDQSLKSECLEKALVHLNGADINNGIRSEASDVVCQTQVVNGLNIKCTFSFRGKKQQCSFYKSFIQTLEIQLEQCKEINDEPIAENTDEKEDDERSLLVEEKDDEQEQVVNESNKENEHTEAIDAEEEDAEAAIDNLNQKMSDQVGNNEDEQQQQPEQIES